MQPRFIYLNKTCFNGLYRVNRKGRFNVPIGRQSNPNVCDSANIKAASEVLKKAELRVWAFDADAVAPQAGDLVYCDPPYDGTFTGYTGNGFDADDQTRLRDCCRRWREAGAYVIVSNSDTELVRDLYSDFVIHEVRAPRSINSAGDGRGKTTDLLMVS